MKVTIVLTDENLAKAQAVIGEAFEAGRLGTTGDHSSTGFLLYVLRALDCDFGRKPEVMRGNDKGTA